MTEQKKEHYEKPQLLTIELKEEEILGSGCKTSSTGAASGFAPCTAGGCSAPGS